ncbi:MAG: FtsW/RodA/SpoVE family cell cycle protein [Caldilineaceae bacterium]
MFDRQLWRHFDWPLLIAVLLLSLIGIGMIYSATINTEELVDRWIRQARFLAAGLVGLFFIAAVDYRHLEVFAPPTFVLLFGSLLAVDQIGTSLETGAQRWLEIGAFSVQPTESGKFFLIIFMAWYLSRFRERLPSFLFLISAMVLLVGPLILIFLQPDLGMTITFAFIGGTLILVNGVYFWQLGMLVVGALLGGAALSFQLQGYMEERIQVFLNPEANQAAAFNVNQALIAVGSGSWWGRGWSLGTQNQLFFLRVRHTDFIFSVIAEELGLIGAGLILALLFFVIWRVLRIADMAQDGFGRLLATGVAAILFFQVTVNVGMNLNILPVTGLTLPFISYGGSSLISMLLAIGLAQSVMMHHRKIEFI